MTQERAMQLFNHSDSELSICVGSWKAYNECNEHSLGSYYNGTYFIDFTELQDEEELDDLLTFIGWTEAEKEELFIQDYSSSTISFTNCDYENPMEIIKTLSQYNNIDYELVGILMEYENMTLEDALDNQDNYTYRKDMTGEEYEEELFYDCLDENTRKLLEESWFSNYIDIDFERMADNDDGIIETDNGLLIKY